MELIAFAGPSLGRPSPSALGRITFEPPARRGDLSRAAASGVAVIGLIDGAFETAPAVWQKEIVFALSRSVVVLGAASIGALRAVELEPFGMIGLGAVFKAYRDGAIEDDDEVAVQHGPAELGYLPVTEAMVNVRATTAAAVRAGALTPGGGAVLRRAAKSLFYKHRTWPQIRAVAAREGLDMREATRFEAWRTASPIDVKKSDAEMLVAAMLHPCPAVARLRPPPLLAETTYWRDHAKHFSCQ